MAVIQSSQETCAKGILKTDQYREHIQGQEEATSGRDRHKGHDETRYMAVVR